MNRNKLVMLSIVGMALAFTTNSAFAVAQTNENGSIGFIGVDQNPYECWTPEGDPCEIDSGDNAWILTSSALVLIMTPGVAFFYGGLARQKNSASTIMMCFIIIGIISVQWVLWGYRLGIRSSWRGNTQFCRGLFIYRIEWCFP